MKSKKLKTVLFSLSILLFSCSKDVVQEKKVTFESIEKEFSFKKPLSQKSKERALAQFSSEENYREYLLDKFALTSIKSKSDDLLSRWRTYRVQYKFFGEGYGLSTEFDCRSDEYILDAAEEAGLDLPYSCRAGACSTCVAYLEDGQVDQADQSFLSENCTNAGYVALCVAYPASNISIITNYEEHMNCDPIRFR
jgi:ferredoxin